MRIHYQFNAWRDSVMSKLSLWIGYGLMVIGFAIYQFGFSVTFNQSAWLGEIARSILPGDIPFSLTATLLEFLGGLIGILGLLISISAAISSQRVEIQRVLGKIESGTIRSEILTVARHPCKFCGATIPESELFCPVCGKSQA
jgi:hypothetical protein